MRWLLALFLASSSLIFGRCLQLEFAGGDRARQQMLAPLTQVKSVPAQRGRILARDGTVLAHDAKVDTLMIHYEHLDAPQPRLAELCGLSIEQWQSRCRQIQARVERMAVSVNRRRNSENSSNQAAQGDQNDWPAIISSAAVALFSPPEQLPVRSITIREQNQEHTIAVNVNSDVRAEIESRPDLYPGVVVRQIHQRIYPSAKLASHIVGYARAADDNLVASQAGVEAKFDVWLSGRRGQRTRIFDASGDLTSDTIQSKSIPGRDVVLTLNPNVQARAEALLDDSLRRAKLQFDRERTGPELPPSLGGAAVVMDIQSGELLALASAPRFNSNDFVQVDSANKSRWLNDSNQAMFHRAIQMAVPPGSVFKPLAAIALMESESFDPAAPMVCRGYLHKPDRQRCLIFRNLGIGHGPMNLDAAITQSCNVYFFNHASRIGHAALLRWAARFGFGQRTGIDLANEAAGCLPSPPQWTLAETQAFAIGQSSLTVTPLQIARMMAAIGNGGHLVRPKITRASNTSQHSSNPIPGLQQETLKAITLSLQHVTSTPTGTAYRAFESSKIDVAGKTGTAQTGSGGADHAWFAGFAPADRPQIAFAVVVEHAGSGATHAAPVARELLQYMIEAGWMDEANGKK
jgi:penicillin-binding protein 2